ncbi:hypothetical protein [Methanococcus maripaludis]|uniref:PEGA domain-containing protein n=1 Tax=Methanococcus maripaludis TaxID=39152 RepID=A0A2L1C9V4_METMI|nr:hypothetical protein [Methanococcus maripaludis]AVB76083.1 hypothetical protein MMJJ_06690 [Methanococcus maripaludis]
MNVKKFGIFGILLLLLVGSVSALAIPFTSNVDEVDIIKDGASIGVFNNSETITLDAGNVTLTFVKDGYDNLTDTFEIIDENSSISITMIETVVNETVEDTNTTEETNTTDDTVNETVEENTTTDDTNTTDSTLDDTNTTDDTTDDSSDDGAIVGIITGDGLTEQFTRFFNMYENYIWIGLLVIGAWFCGIIFKE